jgi:hypothetical protein
MVGGALYLSGADCGGSVCSLWTDADVDCLKPWSPDTKYYNCSKKPM